MKLADRPAYHLARLMSERAISEQTALGVTVWPKLPAGTARGRIRNLLRGHQPRPEYLEALAEWFGVDAGLFYSLPGGES